TTRFLFPYASRRSVPSSPQAGIRRETNRLHPRREKEIVMPRTDPNQSTSKPHPRRPPDWRFRAARRAVADGRVLVPWQADEMTRGLAEYLALEKACQHEAELARLALRCPG